MCIINVMTTGVHWGSLLLLEWFKGHDYYWCITIAYFNASHHAWVSFEATAEVYNEVCKDACKEYKPSTTGS